MNDKYICRTCDYSTDKASDIKRHLFKKISCIKNINGMKMSDDQNIVLSLLPCNKNILHLFTFQTPIILLQHKLHFVLCYENLNIDFHNLHIHHHISCHQLNAKHLY